MKVRSVLKSALAALACSGTLIPQTSLSAADTFKRDGDASQTIKKMTDIELDAHGRLTGVLVDENGRPEALKRVVVRQGKRVIAAAKTDKSGRFEVRQLRGGIYQIASEDQIAMIRVWAHKTAPPKSKTAVLLVTGKVTRGQGFIPVGGISGLLGLGAGIAGLTIGIVNMQEVDDLEDENARLQNDINRLENSLR